MSGNKNLKKDLKKDLWHYPRKELANQIMAMFENGLSSSFIFFAQRRMGKTEFLRKDMLPVAESKGWNVLYFSFLDAADNPVEQFNKALEHYINNRGIISKIRTAAKRISKVSAGMSKVNAGLELNKPEKIDLDIKNLISTLAGTGNTLLLMDEVQALASNPKNDVFIASFRTALDINKDLIKVIFTGSSQTGLRKMFSQAKAPFFHFGQNLNFPELDQKFTAHLCEAFKSATMRSMDSQALWDVFVDMDKVPLFIRSVVERMALNPDLSIKDAQAELKAEIFGNREFKERWESLSDLEKQLLVFITQGIEQLFSAETRKNFAEKLKLEDLPIYTLQAPVKRLLRQGIIGKSEERAAYFIDDPNFKNWILMNLDEFE